jgi:histidinol-phosphate aminotransferase
MMSNESPYPPSQRVVDAIMQAAKRGNTYPTSGIELRRRLGKRDGLDESNVVLGAGSTELIDLVIRTFLAPGEEILVSVPTFSMYEARARVVGGIPVLVPMTEDHDFDVPGLVSAVTERTKVIFLCTPNNPTGNRISEASMRRILRLGLPTVIDEAYHELGETPDSLAHMLTEFPNAMLLRTFSKAFGLAGLRLGYLLAHPAVIRLVMRAKVPWNISALTLAGALAAVEDVDEFERRMTALRAGRAYLEREIAGIPGVSVISGDGNFVLVDVEATGMSSSAIVDGMLTEGVFIRCLAVHHAKRGFVRVTVGTAEQNLQCVRAMRKVVTSRLPRRAPVILTDGVS